MLNAHVLLTPAIVEDFPDGSVEVRFPDPIARGSVVYYLHEDDALDDMSAARQMLNGWSGWPRLDMSDVSAAASVSATLANEVTCDDLCGFPYDDDAVAELEHLIDSGERVALVR